MNRRSFLRNTAAAAGIFAVPTILPSSVFGKDAPANRINVGCIGVGERGTLLLKTLLHNDQAQVVAVSDCFTSRRRQALDTIKEIYTQQGRTGVDAKEYADFRQLLAREDIDAIVIATPDHWHVPLAFYAVGTGKDVYVEKPLGVSMSDSFKLRKLIQDKKAIFQYGTQQRSDYYFRFACELVRNGYIGNLERMDAWCLSVENHKYTRINPPAQPVPDGFDYERWLGPAPLKPYSDARVSNIGAFHIYDYALGFIAGWGAHPLDIAQWGNNTDNTVPVLYEGTGTLPAGGLFDTIALWDMHCTYANGVKMHFMDNETAKPVVSGYYQKMRDHGNTFHGSDGWVTVRRGGIDFSDEKLRRVKFKDTDARLYKSEDHMANFIQCVKTRNKPICTIEAAVQSDLISHLCNAAIRLNKAVEWDPVNEKPVNEGQEINRIINRTAREPWQLRI